MSEISTGVLLASTVLLIQGLSRALGNLMAKNSSLDADLKKRKKSGSMTLIE
jgi:hypothetical protein